MGQAASTEANPPWIPPTGGRFPPEIEEAILALAKNSRTFTEADPLVDGSRFVLEDHYDELEAAIEQDQNLVQWLYKFVPKQMDEYEFWKNYFSHVSVLRKRGMSMIADKMVEQNKANSDSASINVVATSTNGTAVDQESEPSTSLQDIVKLFMLEIEKYTSAMDDNVSRSDPIRFGLVGSIDIKSEAAMFASTKGVVLVGVEAAKPSVSLLKDYNLQSFQNGSSLMKSSTIEACYFSPSNQCSSTLCDNPELMQSIAVSGKRILLSLPLGRNYHECHSIVSSVDTPSSAYFVTPLVFSRRALFLKKVVDSELLGRLGTVQFVLARRPDQSPSLNCRQFGGGSFSHFGTQTLHFLDWLLGPLMHVQGNARRSAPLSAEPAANTEDIVTVMFAAGQTYNIVGTALFNFVSGVNDDRLSLIGTNGRIELPLFGPGQAVIHSDKDELTSFDIGPPDDLRHALSAIVLELANGVPSAAGLPVERSQRVLRTSRLVDASLRSFYLDRSDRFWDRPYTWNTNAL